MTKKKHKKLLLSPLHFEALKLIDEAPSMEDLRKRDMSDLFVAELYKRHEKRYLINIQIRGEQASGKSLVGYTIKRFISIVLLKEKSNVNQICPDQIDFLNKIKDMKVKNTCLMIDEWNELSTTGYNATTTMALLIYFNEVQAQRYIHKICCSPEKIVDMTARIILEVIDKDIPNKTTRCLCFYIVHRDGIRIEQCVGFVDIDVSTAIENKTWLAYTKRKFQRMKNLMEKGIIDNRKSDDSEIILKVVDKLRNMAVVNGIVQRDLVRSYIDIVQDRFTPISIYGEDKLTGTIYGILILLKNVSGINNRIRKLEKIVKKIGSGNIKELKYYKKQLKVWKDSKVDIISKFEESIKNHEDIIQTLRKFDELNEEKVS